MGQFLIFKKRNEAGRGWVGLAFENLRAGWFQKYRKTVLNFVTGDWTSNSFSLAVKRASSPPLRHSSSVVPQNPHPMVVQHRLEREFQQIYPNNVNLMKLDLGVEARDTKHQLRDLIDKARTTLVGNRNQLHQLQCIGMGRVRFGSTQWYKFQVEFGKIHVGVLYSDDVVSWKKFRKPRTIWVSLPFAVISLLLDKGVAAIKLGWKEYMQQLVLPTSMVGNLR
ncbi:hypothetical protein TB2_033937 [Malus domestica]